MVRKLKHHEQKLLRKVDFVTYKSDNNHRDATVLRRYAIQNPDDYQKYNRMVGVCLKIFLSLIIPNASIERSITNDTQQVHKLAHLLSSLPPTSAFRQQRTDALLSKLHGMGLLTHAPLSLAQSSDPNDPTSAPIPASTATLSQIPSKITVSAFCRRRLPVIMTRLHMAETVQAANKLIEQGHVRVGTETVTDTAFLVTRGMEDWVTWSVGSKIKKIVDKYRGGEDDFELL